MGSTREMLTLSGTTDFIPFGEFMISPIRLYIHFCQSWDNVYVLLTGLFVWISLTALSAIYFIHHRVQPPVEFCDRAAHFNFNAILTYVDINQARNYCSTNQICALLLKSYFDNRAPLAKCTTRG